MHRVEKTLIANSRLPTHSRLTKTELILELHSYSRHLLQKPSSFCCIVNIYASRKPTTSYLTVVIVISCVVAVLVLCFVVIMYRRKKALGGFYICTLPPYRDYIKILDQSKFIHEQTHKLPYISEWEFPRGNIALRKYT